MYMNGRQGDEKTVELAQKTLQANGDHLHALEGYTQKLEAELERFDKLFETVEAVDESDLDLGCIVTIPGSVRATAPISMKELLSSESPFREDALKRTRYENVSEVRPMKPKELEVLAEAVQAESYRKHALDIQQRGSSALANSDPQIAPVLGVNDDGIDWDRVADKVSNVYMVTRTARECEIRWRGEQHPDFNREPWTQEEVQKVKSLAAEFIDRCPDWVTVAKRLGTRRTPLDCMRHATSRKLHQWTAEADERLLKAVDIYGHENWHLVARYVSEDATPSQCSSRFQKTLDKSIKHSAWTPEEDARLSAAVAAYGSSWVDVAANVPGRHNDQCRDRWIDHLDPSINKSQWSKEEDSTLIDYVREHKNASWKQVAEHLRNGRTEAMCRNRYAVLQKSAHTVPETPTINSGKQHAPSNQEAESSSFASTSSKKLCFKPYLPGLHTTPTLPETEHNHSKQLVFLEPVVSSNPESHKYHKPHPSQYKTRFKTTMTSDMSPSTAPPSKKRRTQSRTARLPLTET